MNWFENKTSNQASNSKLNAFSEQLKLVARGKKNRKYPCWIEVSIKGAVNNPGIYVMQYGSRLEELIAEAGGKTNDADKTHKIQNYILKHKQILNIPTKYPISE